MGVCTTNVYIPSTTKLQIEGGGDHLRVQDIQSVHIDMNQIDVEVQEPRHLFLRVGKGNIRLDSSHTKMIDVLVGNGGIFSSFTGTYHNIKNLRSLMGETQIYFDDSYSSADNSTTE